MPSEWTKPTIGLCLCEVIMIILLISMAQCSTPNASSLFQIITFYKPIIILSFCRWSYLYWPYLSQNKWNKRKYRLHLNDSQENDISSNLYWKNEVPIYDSDKLNAIRASFMIDTVITHTAPSHCELFSKSNLNQWAENDSSQIEDIQFERKTMDMLLDRLKTDNHPVSHWYYGHFHQSWHSCIDGILYQMLDIMELSQIFWFILFRV